MCPVHVSNNFLDQTLFGSNVYREDAAADFLVKSYNNKNTNKRNTANFLPYLAAQKNVENISSLCVPNDFPSLPLSCPPFHVTVLDLSFSYHFILTIVLFHFIFLNYLNLCYWVLSPNMPHQELNINQKLTTKYSKDFHFLS